MKDDARRIHEALICPTTPYLNGRARYEAVRAAMIAKHGYDGFRELQREAMAEITAPSPP